jgi:hypothetical protein
VADEFKIAGAYVEVNLRDNTAGDEQKIRARIEAEKAIDLETALKDPANTKAVKEAVERSAPAKLPVVADNPIDEAWRRKVQAAVKSAATSAIEVPVTPETVNFRRDLEASLKKSSALLKTEIPTVPADAAKFRVQVEALVASAEAGIKAHIPVEVDKDSAAKAVSEMEKVAARANAQFSALKFVGLSVGLPAAAAIGAAGVVGALALPAVAFTALAFSAASSSDEVQISMQQMVSGVESDVKAAARPLQDEFVTAIGDVNSAWGRMRPAVAAAMSGTGPLIAPLTGAVTDFAEQTMPGMVTAINTGKPALEGLRSFAGSTGAGLSDFFANASRGSDGAKSGFTVLGSVVQLLEGRLGSLFANLANGSSGPMTQLYVIVDQVTGALVNLTGPGGAALGFLSGFGGAASGTVTVLRGLLSVLDALPNGVTQLAGSFAATSMILGKFGIDAGKGFEGLGGKISAADGATGKLKAGVSGLTAGALTPAFAATAALSIGLLILGQQQQRTAESAQYAATTQRTYTSALRESNDVVNDSVRASVAQDLAQKNLGDTGKSVLDFAKQYGVALPDVTSAVTNQGRALDTVVGQLRAYAQAHPEAALAVEGLVAAIQTKANAFHASTSAVEAEAAATSKGAKEFEVMTPAAYAASVAAATLSSSFTSLNTVTGDVAAKGSAIVAVLGTMRGAHFTEEEALQVWNDQMRTSADLLKGLNLKTHAKDFIDAGGAINTASEAGSKFQDFVRAGATDMAAYAQSLKDAGVGSDEITKKLEPMRAALEKQLKAWGLNDTQIKTILDHYGAIPKEITTVLKVEGGEESKIQVQQVIADLLKVPADKGISVTALTGDAIDNLTALGKTVVKLPNGQFQVFANTQPGKDAAAQFVKDTDGKVVTTKVEADTAPALGTVNNDVLAPGKFKANVTVDAITSPAEVGVQDWTRATAQVKGQTTTYTLTDPATGQVGAWARTTNALGATTTTFSSTDPATGAVRSWKQNADGTWAQVHVTADAADAAAAIDYAARPRTSTIYVQTKTSGPGAASQTGPGRAVASGGILSAFAGGGFAGLTPMAGGLAEKVPPNTWRVVGDNMKVPESYIPIDPRSKRSQDLLTETNTLMGRGNGAPATVTHNYYNTFQLPDVDMPALAAAVSREQELRAKVGAF